MVLGFTIGIIIAICHIVPLIIAYQIVKGKPIMCGNEIDARGWPSIILHVDIRTTQKPFGKLPERSRVALPETAHQIAILAIPFCPAWREFTYLVAPYS